MKSRTRIPKFVAKTIRFPGNLWRRIEAEAQKKGLSFSDIVRLSVMETLGVLESDKPVAPASQTSD